ncbi:OmpA family protein [Dyadobacter luticola]|uniref:OmpA family protein n=2 Tax=Dyadobacter luticola TaxID=1979387 RepID=A0A5R9KQ05_9BACT|nr:OmpA family protein [Dyadobacter luticola]
MEVKAAGYQAYNGNLILDKTDEEPRTYIIKLNRVHTILSVNIINARTGMQAQLMEESKSVIPWNRINDGHYYAEVSPGKSYRLGVSGANQSDFSTAVASLKEGLTLKSIRIPEREPAAAAKAVSESSEASAPATAPAVRTSGTGGASAAGAPATKPKTGIIASDRTLYFPRSDYKLPVQSRTYLDSLASYVTENKGKGLRITGHTDNVGNPNLNVTLSEYRVRVITRYLVNKGVPENMIVASGEGSKHPVVPNDTEENRRKNRRVEVQIVDLQETRN